MGLMKQPTPTPSIAPSNKNLLGDIVMKVTQSPLQTGSIVYDTVKVQNGYQCTVSMPVLGGEYLTTGFTGNVCAQNIEAENNAAEVAVEAVQSDLMKEGIDISDLVNSTSQPVPKKPGRTPLPAPSNVPSSKNLLGVLVMKVTQSPLQT